MVYPLPLVYASRKLPATKAHLLPVIKVIIWMRRHLMRKKVLAIFLSTSKFHGASVSVRIPMSGMYTYMHVYMGKGC